MTTWGSLQTGIRYALAQGFESVITIVADGRYEVEEIPALLKADPSADVVVGYFEERHSQTRRIAWQWLRLVTGFPLRDFVSGFRLYRHSALRIVAAPDATLLDYQDIGTLLLMRRAKLGIAEVALPMHTNKPDRSRMFQSWANAIRYVAVSTLLGLAHLRSIKASD
jgi:hypothetical protein